MARREDKNDKFSLFYAIALAWQFGFLMVVIILGFTLGGYFLDKRLGTSPLFLILGIIIAIPLAGYESWRLFLPMIKKSKKPRH